MRYSTLGSTGLKVSVIGLGTWAMGGRWWGPTDDPRALRTIQKAIDLGINLIDTADIYGFGHSESLLGQALKTRRRDIVLATKVGLRWNNKKQVRHDLSPQHILKAVDASLKRLQTDYIDVYQVHWPDPATPIVASAEALMSCVEAGKVRFLGFSNLSIEQMDEFRQHGKFEICQPPLNLFEREIEKKILPYCEKEKIGVLTYSPLCRGLLSGRFKPKDKIVESVRKRDPLFNGASFLSNLAKVEALRKMASQEGMTVAQWAVAWVLAHAGVTTALCGARKAKHLAENIAASRIVLDDEMLDNIDAVFDTNVTS